VFYVHPSGTFTSIGSDGGSNCKYLEAAPADLEGEFEWCSDTTSLLDVTATGIGAGMANTTTVVNKCARRWRRRRDSSSAIHAAANYVNNGKTDWHLPSIDELNELCKYAWSLDIGGGDELVLAPHSSFSADFYWSSSEYLATSAWFQNFGTGNQNFSLNKTDTFRVRPVRAF
jgi:hypothetical protein